MVFRKVIQVSKDAIKELEKMWNGDDDDKECYIGKMTAQSPKYFIHCSESSFTSLHRFSSREKLCTSIKSNIPYSCPLDEREEEVKACMSTLLHDCLLGEVPQGDQSGFRKRKRTGGTEGGSKVWLYFTKIYTTDPKQVYAVCHCCDRCYKGHSKNGTSHLKRHNETCSSKHRKVQGKMKLVSCFGHNQPAHPIEFFLQACLTGFSLALFYFSENRRRENVLKLGTKRMTLSPVYFFLSTFPFLSLFQA